MEDNGSDSKGFVQIFYFKFDKYLFTSEDSPAIIEKIFVELVSDLDNCDNLWAAVVAKWRAAVGKKENGEDNKPSGSEQTVSSWNAHKKSNKH